MTIRRKLIAPALLAVGLSGLIPVSPAAAQDILHPTVIGTGTFAVTPSGGVQSLVGVFECTVTAVGELGFVVPPGPGTIVVGTSIEDCSLNGHSAPAVNCVVSRVCATAGTASFVEPGTDRVCWSGTGRFLHLSGLIVEDVPASGCSTIGVPDLP